MEGKALYITRVLLDDWGHCVTLIHAYNELKGEYYRTECRKLSAINNVELLNFIHKHHRI